MDLAKIRQKARQEQEGFQADSVVPQPVFLPDQDVVMVPSEQTAADVSVTLSSPLPVETVAPRVRDHHSSIPSSPSRVLVRDPLETIIAGREASGCDEEHIQAVGEVAAAEEEQYFEYLCFRVSAETYGINIMDIKEIIKPREVTEVPRAPSFVSGVISLRGIIIPIIDMRERLGLSRADATGRERVVVVRYGESFSGLLVDEIIQVVHIAKDCLEPAPAVLEGIDREFVTGIGRSDGRMIILLNLEKISDIDLY